MVTAQTVHATLMEPFDHQESIEVITETERSMD